MLFFFFFYYSAQIKDREWKTLPLNDGFIDRLINFMRRSQGLILFWKSFSVSIV